MKRFLPFFFFLVFDKERRGEARVRDSHLVDSVLGKMRNE